MRRVQLLSLLVPVLILVTGCGAEPATTTDAGQRVWQAQGCAGCHGEPGEIRSTAPPLTDLPAHWDRDTLADYLADPEGVKARTPRLQYLNEQYPVIMPRIDASPEDLQLLAEYLLHR